MSSLLALVARTADRKSSRKNRIQFQHLNPNGIMLIKKWTCFPKPIHSSSGSFSLGICFSFDAMRSALGMRFHGVLIQQDRLRCVHSGIETNSKRNEMHFNPIRICPESCSLNSLHGFLVTDFIGIDWNNFCGMSFCVERIYYVPNGIFSALSFSGKQSNFSISFVSER